MNFEKLVRWISKGSQVLNMRGLRRVAAVAWSVGCAKVVACWTASRRWPGGFSCPPAGGWRLGGGLDREPAENQAMQIAMWGAKTPVNWPEWRRAIRLSPVTIPPAWRH